MIHGDGHYQKHTIYSSVAVLSLVQWNGGSVTSSLAAKLFWTLEEKHLVAETQVKYRNIFFGLVLGESLNSSIHLLVLISWVSL